ncbi:MAG: DegT/DnrJ/EryC1/StrS family aminotransferase [Minisyncoccia bacterium]
MDIPFWAPGRTYQTHKQEILAAIDRIASAGQLVAGEYGKDIAHVESRLKEMLEVKHFILTGSGTQSLFLVYKNLLQPGDEVITTSHTFVATIDQIKAVGAIPVFVDIDDTGLIDPMEVEKAITPKTKMIVPVHLEGKVCDMESIMSIAKKHNLFVVEDACQALGAITENWPRKKAGSIGIAGCFSFYPAKIFGSLGNLGGVATNDDELAKKVRDMSSSYRFAKLEDRGWGYNLEPDNLQAAVLNAKWDKLSSYWVQRSRIAEKYNEAFADLPIVLPLKQFGRVYQDYVIRVPERKEEFCAHLKENGVGILGHDLVPNHKYPLLGFDVSLPKTEQYMVEQVRIPCTPDHTDEEISYVIKVIREFYGR